MMAVRINSFFISVIFKFSGGQLFYCCIPATLDMKEAVEFNKRLLTGFDC